MNLLGIATGLIDKIFPDPVKNKEAKAALIEAESKGQLKELEIQASIINQEAAGESWLQRNWRPLVMMTFTGLVVAHWLGFTPENLSIEETIKLLDIVQLGLGGYVVGRSVEKSLPKAVQVIDALRKK